MSRAILSSLEVSQLEDLLLIWLSTKMIDIISALSRHDQVTVCTSISTRQD